MQGTPEGKYVALTVRKLKPGSYDQWREAWEGDRGDWPDFPVEAYVLRNRQDPDEIVAFGFFEADPSGETSDEERNVAREEAMAPFIASLGADGVYEVIDRVSHSPKSREPAGAAA